MTRADILAWLVVWVILGLAGGLAIMAVLS
jgi:hypothetical protein